MLCKELLTLSPLLDNDEVLIERPESLTDWLLPVLEELFLGEMLLLTVSLLVEALSEDFVVREEADDLVAEAVLDLPLLFDLASISACSCDVVFPTESGFEEHLFEKSLQLFVIPAAFSWLWISP